MNILTLNLIATTLVFYVAARIYLLPQLGRLSPRAVLIPILLLHSLRHLGLMFLTRGATYIHACRHSLRIQRRLGTCSPRFWLSLLSFSFLAILPTHGLWFGSSTCLAPSICSMRLPWRRFTTPQSLWDQPIGFLRFGFLLYCYALHHIHYPNQTLEGERG